MEFKKIEFIKKVHEYAGVYSFYFKNEGINFEPGQSCHLLVEEGETREGRVMTFASLPTDDYLMFTMHIDSGTFFKNHMMNLKEGDTVNLFKIVGKLKVDNTSDNKHIFISGGIGLIPYRSIVKASVVPKEKMEILQIQRGEYLFKEELEKLVNSYHSINPSEFHNSIEKVIDTNREANFYLCGSKRFIEGAIEIFKDLNVNENQIQIEGFYKDSNKESQKPLQFTKKDI